MLLNASAPCSLRAGAWGCSPVSHFTTGMQSSRGEDRSVKGKLQSQSGVQDTATCSLKGSPTQR